MHWSAPVVNGLIAVQYRLLRQLPRQFVVRFGHRRADLFPHVLHRSQTQRYSQYMLHRFHHHSPRHPAGHRLTGDQRRQLRPEVPFHFFRQSGLSCLSALYALQFVALIFRDMRFDLRQLGYLMTLRFALFPARPVSLAERLLAVAALRWVHWHHLADTLGRKQVAMVSSVSWSSAGFPAALLSLADHIGAVAFPPVRRMTVAWRMSSSSAVSIQAFVRGRRSACPDQGSVYSDRRCAFPCPSVPVADSRCRPSFLNTL